MYGLFGFLCWCDIIVEQEDSTYPPSVEECPRTADNVPQTQQRQTTHYILSSMFKPILLKNLFWQLGLRNQRDRVIFNLILIDLCVLNPLITSGSYLLQRPEGVHYRLDLLLFIQTQEFVHYWFHEATSPLFEEQVEERKSSYDFVLFV